MIHHFLVGLAAIIGTFTVIGIAGAIYEKWEDFFQMIAACVLIVAIIIALSWAFFFAVSGFGLWVEKLITGG